MMTVKECSDRVKSEIRRKKNLVQKLAEIKSDIKATNKAIHFWEGELKKAKKLGK